MKNSMHIAVYLMLQHLSFVIGTVTLDFNSIGYIEESIVLQCTDTAAITVNSADWYRGGSQLDISLSRYNQTKIANGFNLTIFPVSSSDGGVYHCGIDFGVSSTKVLTIYYNTKDKDVNVARTDSPKRIDITIIAFPDPVYTVTVTQGGNLTAVNWTISKTTETSGAIKVFLTNSAAFLSAVADKNYTVVVSITSPVTLVVTRYIIWVSPQTTTVANGTNLDITAADCALESVLGLALGVGVGNDTICIICLIFIVILVKIVNIQAKDNLQKPIPKGSDVTITASVCGFCKSRVQWIGPHGNISASKGKYSIQDSKNTRICTLKIKNLEINESGFYTCRAKSSCGSSVQDSVRITAYDKLAVDIDIGETLRQHGSDVKITCSVYGSENKSVDWTGQEENILTNGGRYTIASYDSSTNKSSLVIRTSSMTDAEGYICQVAFRESGVSVKIYITVSDNGSLRVIIEKIILSVPASANVSKEWIGPQGKALTNPENYTIVPYDSNTNKSHLTIKSFSVNDNGSYTCKCKNISGSSPENSITITTNDTTNPNKGASKLILGLGFGIICVACIVCIVILVMIGKPCALKLGLGLGLGLGIPFLGCIIVIVILVKKVLKPPPAPENRKIKSGSKSDVSRGDVEIQMEEKGFKSNEERPLVIDNRIGNKDESETEHVLSKPFDLKERRPLPPLNKELKDKPNHRPQPIPSEKNDVKDQNRRGLSANFEDARGLASETPRTSKLPPIQLQGISTVQEEGTLEEPKKNKKNRKKKDKTDEEKHADEIAK